MAQRSAEQITNKIGDRADELAQDARKAMTEAAEDTVEDAKTHAEDELRATRDAAQAAEQELPDNSLQAAAVQQAVGLLDSALDGIRGKDFDTLVQDVTRFARANPLLFLGGAAIAGFALARFLKSGGGATPRYHVSEDDPWSGHLHRPAPGGAHAG